MESTASPLLPIICWIFLPVLGLIIVFSLRKNNGENFKENVISQLEARNSTYSVLNLLPGEKKRHLKTPSISTVTFYEGSSPLRQLQQRVQEIICANPFLRSRLIRLHKSEAHRLVNQYDTATGVCAVYPTVYDPSADELDFFQLVKNSDVSSDMPYEKLMKRVRQYDVPLGEAAVDKDIPLFRVTLIEIEQNKRYCMMVSLCHTIADGFTFYKVYSMLNRSSPVESIDVKRVIKFSKDLSGNLNFGTAWWELPFVIWGSLYNRFLQPKMEARVCLLNNECIQAEKNAYMTTQQDSNGNALTSGHKQSGNGQASKPAFLSTNDIITSWFFRFCRADMGFMIANFRGRKSYLSDTHGGNYQGRIFFLRPDMQKPESVRESIEHFRPTSGATVTLSQIAAMNIALVTNWATFYTDVEFAQCKQVIHLPVIDVSSAVLRQCLVIFQANKGKLGAIFWTRGIEQRRFEEEQVIRPLNSEFA